MISSGDLALAGAALVIASAIVCGPGLARSAEPVAERGAIEVIVPQVAIYPGDKIREGLLTTKVIRANDAVLSAVFTSSADLEGRVARRTLVPGQPITKDAVRAFHVVTQGQRVAIRFQSQSISIVMTGFAVQAGGVGDVISVRNTDTGRLVRARIRDAETLTVVGP